MGAVTKKERVAVSMRALVQRINRHLKENDEIMKSPRGRRMRWDVGDFYVIDAKRNFVVSKDVDPEALGRELGVLKPWEKVEEIEEGR